MNRRMFALLLLAAPLMTGCGYNRIQSLTQEVDAAQGNIQAQLQRRADLIPNLVNTVKGYAEHEDAVFTQVTQARASLRPAPVNLGHSIIRAPIDGIVISRSVDVGQTVAASTQAPILFVIAKDLKQMRVNAAPDAVGFYEKTGWHEESWDPEELVGIASNCIQMVKTP